MDTDVFLTERNASLSVMLLLFLLKNGKLTKPLNVLILAFYLD